MLRRIIATFFIMALLGAGLVSASPLSTEGSQKISSVSSDKTVAALYDTEASSDGSADVSAVILDKENGLHPALLLFLVALIAIGWLGRRRKNDYVIED